MPNLSEVERLARVREVMRANFPPLDALIVPTADAHNSEYPAACDRRRAYLTGFNGSAGTAVVTQDKALLWTDGRYHLQAEQQLDSSLWTLMKEGLKDVKTVTEFLQQENCVKVVGIDPFTATVAQATSWRKALADKLDAANDKSLVLTSQNLVDVVWDADGRPEVPTNPVFVLENKFTGETSQDKIKFVREEMTKQKCSHVVLTALDDIAWLLNLRGGDSASNPVFISYVIISNSFVRLYIHDNKLDADARQSLESVNVEVKLYESAGADLAAIANDCEAHRVMMDPTVNVALHEIVEQSKSLVLLAANPIKLKKATKNSTELEGMKSAHKRDAVAVILYLSWLESLSPEELSLHTEITVSDKLEAYRTQQDLFMGLSFESISGIGPNGAIIHYRAEPSTCRAMSPSMYLIDSGGHYRDGTTDITRTVHLGDPTDYEKECWTQVLKGHIALGSARFPAGTSGSQLDVLARVALWRSGRNYAHGTGHGVGHFLHVHEAPPAISMRRSASGDAALLEGMVVSNEPGYYEKDRFGVRHESLVCVKKSVCDFKDREFLEFEDLTLVPFQKKLICWPIFSESECRWLNAYHERIWDSISPMLPDDDDGRRAKVWLREATEAVTRTEQFRD